MLNSLHKLTSIEFIFFQMFTFLTFGIFVFSTEGSLMHCVLPTVTLPTTDLQNYRLFFSSLSKFSNNYKVHYKAQNLRLTPVAYSMK